MMKNMYLSFCRIGVQNFSLGEILALKIEMDFISEMRSHLTCNQINEVDVVRRNYPLSQFMV